ncbi:MAG: hypothetical protein H6700_11375 [Myxococcales bacterium]|nr:hypothetical protein [Myxococcales bacterium]
MWLASDSGVRDGDTPRLLSGRARLNANTFVGLGADGDINACEPPLPFGSEFWLPGTEEYHLAYEPAVLPAWGLAVYTQDGDPGFGAFSAVAVADPAFSVGPLAVLSESLGPGPAAGAILRISRTPASAPTGAGELVEVPSSSRGAHNNVPLQIEILERSEYVQLAEGEWADADEVDWRLASSRAAMTESQAEQADAVDERANVLREAYQLLRDDGFASWDTAVVFPDGRFDGVPALCVEPPTADPTEVGP